MIRAPKKKTQSKLIEQLDALHSEFIRRRFANEKGIVKCWTCDREYHWKQIQCGHFQSRRHRSTRWDELNTMPQCTGCNVFKQGQQYIFGKKLDQVYGTGTAEGLEQKARLSCKLTTADLTYMIEQTKEKLKNYE